MKRVIGAILFVVYSIIAITVTILLLSFNNYNCSEIGDYTVFIANDDSLEPTYEKGSILLIEGSSDKHVKIGDELFFYRVINSKEFEVITRTLESKVQQGRHVVYTTTTGENFDSSYFIGKTQDTTIIGAPWGTILSILESKWGYLFCIVIVSLLLFLQEVFDLIIEIKYGGTKGTKAANIANAKKAAKKGTPVAKTTSAKTTTVKKTTPVQTVAKTVSAVKEANNAQTEE